MTRSLERAANKFWTDRKKYSLHSLSYDLNLWERDLLVTPNFVPLNERHCEPTDLTPLLYARARPVLASARTEPVVSQPHEIPRMPSLPHDPRKDYATLSVGSPVPFSRRSDGQEESQTDMIPIDIPVMEDCQTVRISGLRKGTVAEDVTGWLLGFQVPGLANMQPGPIAQHPPNGTNTMTITLPSIALAKQVLKLGGEEFHNQSGRLGNHVTMDMNLMGLTTIYSSAEGPHQEPNVDIVFVHGAYGHPINSFASHYVSPRSESTSAEMCWPRDELPRLLETSGVFPRVMVYGWQADVWLSPHGNASSFADDFRTQLRNARIAAPQRPLVFFGHGLGGILIKEAVNNTIYSDIQEGYFETSVKLCCFLATPHRAYRDQDFASVLTAMKTLLNSKPAVVRQPRVQDLKGRNHALENISSEFDALRQEYGISLLSAGESVRTQDHIIVPEECAIFSETTKDRINLDCNYNDLARLPKTSVNRDNGLRHMSDRIIEQLKPSHHQTLDDAQLAKKREKVYGRLRKYDTVFLIDDSGSMYGRRWYTASKALADTAAIAVRYDRDGIDVKFFNEPLEDNEGKNITSSERVMELFSKVQPEGPTLTADLLEAELNEYMYQYDRNRSKRGLNLIILTDGEPEEGQDVERVIIKYANQLRDARAPLFHVGIQFVQIGADSTATEFLRRLDSKLKGTHNLDRDVSLPSILILTILLASPSFA
ncbi:MAG: hypothetical protein L6R38_006406 [Xanthoria sp. 2 TBL-2021]|nr:MAG: hypothetical protein L6R38_006406 [Xanthoria sp. 2 TBL-2021]